MMDTTQLFMILRMKTYLFIYFDGMGFELRALRLQSRCSTTWATPLVQGL
jgi:hypothetical protein